MRVTRPVSGGGRHNTGVPEAPQTQPHRKEGLSAEVGVTYDSSFRAQVAVPGGSRSLSSSAWERSLSARLRKLRLEFLPSSVKS